MCFMQLLSKSGVSGWCKVCVINFEVVNLIPTNKIKDVVHVVIGFVNSIVSSNVAYKIYLELAILLLCFVFLS